MNFSLYFFKLIYTEKNIEFILNSTNKLFNKKNIQFTVLQNKNGNLSRITTIFYYTEFISVIEYLV